MSVPDLEALLAATRDELAAAPMPPAAGLADVFARAQRFDGTLALPIEEAARLDALDDAALARVARIGSLETLLASAREELAAQPHPQRVAAPPARARSKATWPLVLAAIAAVLVLALAVTARLRRDALDEAARGDYSGANQTATEPPSAQVEVTPPRREAVVVPSSAPAPTPVPVEPPPVAVSPVEPARPEAIDVEAKLERLDAAAREAWKRGDLVGAEASFEALIRAGGRRAIVELAFGDRFELARQRGDATAEAALWQRYVRRFPRGRYVDEARAGLCRRASGDAALQCWQRYLDDRPEGAYRDQAVAALRDDRQ
ncbi:MAG: hypothetical protein K1X88_18575 [Nannocystaceae bacterium]|nr:hypothetical protein [Nannocystaceae bacterium]